MIEEESMQQSLLQTKFEARKRLGKIIFLIYIIAEKSIGLPSEPLVFSELENVIQKKTLSDSDITDHNLGFLMSKLSTGLGLWYLPKGGPK